MTKSKFDRPHFARRWAGGEPGVAVCSCADAPDMTPVYQAAKESAELGKEALAWYKEQAAAQQPLIQRAADRADQVADKQLAMMDQQINLAGEYDAYRKRVFQPGEEKLMADAMTFNTDQERERMAGEAGGDVAQAFGSARDQLRRDVGRAGINPADGAFTSSLSGMAGQEALQTSFLKNKTRNDAKTMGRAMLTDAVSLGRNLPAQQATAAGIALNAGNAGVQNGMAPVTLSSGNINLAGQGYNMGMQGLNQSGNLYLGGAKTEYGDGGAGMAQGAGAAIGGIAMAI